MINNNALDVTVYEKSGCAILAYKPVFGTSAVIVSVRGSIVQKLLLIAEDYDIPVLKNLVLAEALSLMPAVSFVPEHRRYQAAAEGYIYCNRIDADVRKN
jgi:type III secretion system FlhB-like substrate exporter